MGQAIAVHQLIDPVTLGGRCVKQRHRPLVGHRAQEALLYLSALDALPLFELPGQDAVGPFRQLFPQGVGEQSGPHILEDLRRRPQASIGPLVAALIARHAGHDLLAAVRQALLVVAVTHIYISVHYAGILGLHHMGGGPVHQGHPQLGEQQRVQRVRISGA